VKILSIDTSSEACSASLNIDGELVTQYQLAPQKHSSLILPMCDELLSQCELTLTQLDAVAFGRGPGSFTGLRIAAGVVQGIAFGADLPVIKVSTLAALAQQIKPDPKLETQSIKIIAAIDARMQEIYCCVYTIKNGQVDATMDETINAPDDVNFKNILSANDTVFGIGTGWREYKDSLTNKPLAPPLTNIFDERLTSAQEIGLLAARKLSDGDVVSAAEAIPVYLRNNVAKKSSKLK